MNDCRYQIRLDCHLHSLARKLRKEGKLKHAYITQSSATGVILNDDTFKVIKKKDDLEILHGGKKIDVTRVRKPFLNFLNKTIAKK